MNLAGTVSFRINKYQLHSSIFEFACNSFVIQTLYSQQIQVVYIMVRGRKLRLIIRRLDELIVHVFQKRFTERQFIAHFGATKLVVAVLIIRIEDECDDDLQPLHLLMGLHFLKVYATESVNAAHFRCDENTYRNHAWRAIRFLSDLKLIVWSDRHKYGYIVNRCKVLIDGTDCRIFESTPFDPKWFSHKFNGPGIRYEVGLAINGLIVWINGGFPCGEWSDIEIARSAIIHQIDDGEKIIVDSGYRGEDWCFECPNGRSNRRSRILGLIRARHENLNGKLKQFGVLSQKFRHELHKHPMCLYAVANITQVSLQTDSHLFHVEY